MRCAKCQHYISKATATVTTADGQKNFGPVCAEREGLIPARVRSTRKHGRRAQRKDTRQMELLG